MASARLCQAFFCCLSLVDLAGAVETSGECNDAPAAPGTSQAMLQTRSQTAAAAGSIGDRVEGLLGSMEQHMQQLQEQNKELETQMMTMKDQLRAKSDVPQQTSLLVEPNATRLPSWTALNLGKLNLTGSECEARTASRPRRFAHVSLESEAATAGEQFSPLSARASLKCSLKEGKLQRFAGGRVTEQCCPGRTL